MLWIAKQRFTNCTYLHPSTCSQPVSITSSHLASVGFLSRNERQSFLRRGRQINTIRNYVQKKYIYLLHKLWGMWAQRAQSYSDLATWKLSTECKQIYTSCLGFVYSYLSFKPTSTLRLSSFFRESHPVSARPIHWYIWGVGEVRTGTLSGWDVTMNIPRLG